MPPPIPPDQCSPYGTPAAPSAPPSATQPPSRHGDRGARDDDDQTRYLTGPQVLVRYGISDMALWRWLRDPELQFPQPSMVVKGRRYWSEDALIQWERSAATRQSPRRSKPPPARRPRR